MSCPQCKNNKVFWESYWRMIKPDGTKSDRIKYCPTCNFKLNKRYGEEDLYYSLEGSKEQPVLENIDKPKKHKKTIADIIIPHHNRHDLLKNLLDKLPNDLFNIIIVSGGTFAENCNKGAKIAKTNNLIFMNDDIEPDIDLLVKSIENKADIVGFTEYVEGKISKGIGLREEQKEDLLPTIKKDKDILLPLGFLFRIKKKVWKDLKGFDKQFKNGVEDIDLFLRAKEKEYTFSYLNEPVKHICGASEDRKFYATDNVKKFYKKWTETKLKKIFDLNELFTKWELTEPVKDKVDIVFVETIKGEAKEAIKAVKENTKHPYKISIYNNTKDQDTNLSRMWNEMAKKSKCKYICYLNTDAFVSEGWLTELMKVFKKNNIGSVGPSGDNIGGDQRKMETREEAIKHINEFKELKSISGYCFITKKSILNKIPFPEDVEFYGGESLWSVDLIRNGYINVWSQGSWVSHQHSDTVRELGRLDELREKGRKQVAEWEEKTAPVLFTTYNRLEFTKKSLKSLLNSAVQNIIIIDNASTDGTQDWLKRQKSKKIKKIIFNKENLGVAGAMTQFFELTYGERFVGKVDNDTIVSKHWFRDLIYNCERHEISMMQAKHNILHPRYNTFEDWIKDAKELEEGIYQVHHVGGSGVAIRRDRIESNIVDYQNKSKLSGWTEYQLQKENLKKAFTDKVEIKLLDMIDDNSYDFESYPNYYKEVGRDKERYLGELDVRGTFETIDTIIGKLGEKFAYTRFGDGELLMMKDFKGRPDTQYNSPEFRQELIKAFNVDNPNYLLAISAGMVNEKYMEEGLFARFENDSELQNIVREHYFYNKTFYNPIALCYLLVFYPNLLKQVFDKLKEYKLGFIGGKHLEKIKDILPVKFIEIPKTQAFDTIDKWYSKVLKQIKGLDIVLISAGPTANVLQRKLWEDSDVSTIDVGSLSSALTGNDPAKHTWIKMAQDKIKEFYV